MCQSLRNLPIDVITLSGNPQGNGAGKSVLSGLAYFLVITTNKYFPEKGVSAR